MKSLLIKVYRFLASVKLAVVLLLLLAAILAAATYYEALYDAPTARHLVYDSAWFALFLALLGVNVFCAAAIRYPWKKHQVGFVVTHGGILVLLTGSLLTVLWGVDGRMALLEGQTGHRVVLDEPLLIVEPQEGEPRRIPAEFRWNPPREDRPYRYPLGHGLTAVVDRYYHHARQETERVEASKGPPAALLRLSNDRGVEARRWLVAGDGATHLGPARLELLEAPDEVALSRMLAPEEETAGSRGTLQVLVEGRPWQGDVGRLLAEEMPLGDSGYRVQVLRYLPHAVVEEDELVSASDEPVNPVVEVRFRGPRGGVERWLLFARLPHLNTKIEQTGGPLPVRALYQFPEAGTGPRASLKLVVGPRGRLYYRFGSGEGDSLEVGREVPTPWMDLSFAVERFLPHSRSRSRYREVEVESGQEGPPPALRLTLEGAVDPGPYWVGLGESVEAETPEGKRVRVGYGMKTVETGFALTLLDFQVDYDPGTRNPAAYRSRVRVEGEERVIQMNQPLKKNGFTFFQASYQEIDGEPVISVFAVSRDPGIALKYLGSAMIVLGIAIMFYLRPYQIARARGRKNPPPDEKREA